MCYSEFSDIIDAIAALDADVISIETSRSRHGAARRASRRSSYPNEIGPGVYDIHSPRVPTRDEIDAPAAPGASTRSRADRLWVNPDCGLKTRRDEEVAPGPRAHGRRREGDAEYGGLAG